MELNQVMKERRSIRRFRADAPVERALVEEMLEAAIQAPSWKNYQTSRYYVIMSEDMVKKAKDNCLPAFNQRNCEHAPVLIVTAFIKNRVGFDREGNPDNELGNEWGAYDLGLHNANLVLKARDLGLDTLIMGIRDSEALRQLLNIDPDQEVVSVIAVGYRDIEPDMPPRKSVEEIAAFY